MITRPHVCLKCQLRLATRVPPRPSKIQAAFNSTSANRPDPRSSQHSGEDREQGEVIKRPYLRPEQLHQENLSRHPLRAQIPTRTVLGLRGKKPHEERERLDIDALGEPTDVIILKDSKFRTYSHAERLEPDEDPESVDILAALDNERGLPGQQEIEDNINQFRPNEGGGPQDWDAFNALVKDIQAGFTTSQLARYVRSFSKARGDDPSTTRDRLLIPNISPWIPETSKAAQHSDDIYTRGYSLASYTNKQKLVLKLLRDCWKVEVPELEFGVGEVELELKPKDYDLLLRGSRPVLGLIAAENIGGEDERVEGFRSKHTIRITTTRQKSEVIINEIEDAIRHIRRANISLGDLIQPGLESNQLWKWADTQFSRSSIEYLSRMTNTEIVVLPKKKLLISCIDQQSGSVTGSKIDLVIRLLLTSANFSNRVTNWLGSRQTTKSSSGVFVAYPAIEGLGWRDRLRQWTRWTAPIAKRPDDKDESEDSNVALKTPEKEAILPPAETENPEVGEVTEGTTAAVEGKKVIQTKDASALQPELDGPARWQDSYRLDSSALIGSVLHSYDDTAKISTAVIQPRGKPSKVNRTFTTAVPNLSRILSSKFTRGIRRKPYRTLVMHFQPNPFFKSPKTSETLGGAALSTFPPIEMRFSIDQATNAFKARSIVAIASVNNSDLMLPESPSDVRFQQRSVSPLLPMQPSGEYPPGIAEFLRNATLDISQGNFTAPARLTIPIAAHLFRDAESDLLGEAGEDGARDVEYLFTGLEIRKTVVMAYEGWRLHYTSIEAGGAGGRRGELRLLPVRLGKSARPATEEEFVDAACRLAEGVEEGGLAREARLARTVHAPKPVTMVWSKTKRDSAGNFPPGYTWKGRLRSFFSRRVDIRRPVPLDHDADLHARNMEELGEQLAKAEDMEHNFGEEGDEDEFA